jgi:hypothetical protein
MTGCMLVQRHVCAGRDRRCIGRCTPVNSVEDQQRSISSCLWWTGALQTAVCWGMRSKHPSAGGTGPERQGCGRCTTTCLVVSNQGDIGIGSSIGDCVCGAYLWGMPPRGRGRRGSGEGLGCVACKLMPCKMHQQAAVLHCVPASMSGASSTLCCTPPAPAPRLLRAVTRATSALAPWRRAP